MPHIIYQLLFNNPIYQFLSQPMVMTYVDFFKFTILLYIEWAEVIIFKCGI